MFKDNLKEYIESKGLSQSDLAEMIDSSQQAVSDFLSSDGKPRLETKKKYFELVGGFEDFYKQKTSNNNHLLKTKDQINISATNEQETFKGVPAYGVEVTSHVTTSFSDIPESPEFYVDYKPFNDCTCYVINYGDSMHPEYKSGERLAVKQIFNLDVICWGEAYLVVTNGNANDLRGVKRVHFHKDLSKVILRSSNPLYAGDMVINKEDIISMYIVKGKISQNSI
ncbi:XRE family transcriptional regulator [Tenacibaculum piscium]|nr:XRE family transcriptional regulator [Tenacibaculum piscium]